MSGSSEWVLLTDAVREAADLNHSGSLIRRHASKLGFEQRFHEGRVFVRAEDADSLAGVLDRLAG